MKLYHTETQVDYDTLMIELEEKGYKWLSGNKPTHFRYWEQEKENSCIEISGKDITFGSIEWHKKEYPGTPIIKYKAKGENMLNTECKQCQKKWHHDNAKYCSMCGNKLVDEPEFKVGDIVVDDGSYLMMKVDEASNSVVCGKICYNFRYSRVRINFVCETGYLRRATPEEIAEYESALQFHKRGREPFEVKKGDLIRTPSEKITLIWNPENFTKEEFLDYGWKLLKTAEEIDEWLGADDE